VVVTPVIALRHAGIPGDAVGRVVPDDGEVAVAVAQVVHREVGPVDVDGPQLDLVVVTRPQPGHVFDDGPVAAAQNVVVDAGAAADRAPVPVEPVTVLVKVTGAASASPGWTTGARVRRSRTAARSRR
jgi:hypothetical protein